MVLKVSFLRVKDLKVSVLDISNGGERWGGAEELECVEVMEDSEEMDMAIV